MNLHEIARILRTRWITLLIATSVGVLAAIGITLLTTPLYEASTRLYVSSNAGSSASERYSGSLLSQDRVRSYTELLKGETVAQRTIDKMNLDISPLDLQKKVNVNSKVDTVLISLKVRDGSAIRARDIANSMSDEFVDMVRELETPRPGAEPDARVVVEQRAAIPRKPVVPQPVRNVALGLLLGLVSGMAIAVVRDLLDSSVKTPESLESVVGVGLVGAISLEKERQAEPAISFETDTSPIAEDFRKLRTNLQFLAVDNPPRLIVVTSSLPSEGKSVTAINIALALAEAEHNVLLVDGDLRRPSVSKYLDVLGSVGLSNVLSGQATTSEVIQDTKFPRLSVLAAGPTPPNPSELLGSMAAKKLLVELKSQFDYVIIDSSPLLAVTDGAILAANADGALMMVRFGQTKREQLAHSVKNLQDVGATLLGAVMTLVPVRGGRSYYNYGYYGQDTDGKQRSARL